MKTRYIVIAAAGTLVYLAALIGLWFWVSGSREVPLSPRVAGTTNQQRSPKAYTSEGFTLLHRQRQFSNAIVMFEACIREYPNFADGYHGMAQAQREAGDAVSALTNHNRAVELEPDRYDLYWERGVTYARMKDYGGAITNFEACLERNRRFANAHLGLGEAYRNVGDFKAALAHHDEAIALNPSSAWYHRERGNTYRRMGDDEHAEADFAKARELEQNRK